MRPFRLATRLCGAVLLATMALALSGCLSVFSGFGGSADTAATRTHHLTQIRSAHGLSGLSPDARLEAAAKRQAGYMARAGKMTHDTGRGRDFASRMKDDGIEGAAAENVAHGRMDLDRLFQMWMDSSGHRRNMLDPRFARYGLGSAEDAQGRKYWALVLGR